MIKERKGVGVMAKSLKNLRITSTDLVDAGANPDAHIRLFKRAPDGGGSEPDTGDGFVRKVADAVASGIAAVFGKGKLPEISVAKEATTFDEELQREILREVTSEMWGFCYSLSDSFYSIIYDNEMDADAKRDMMFLSLDEFAETARNAIPQWAAGKKAGRETVVKELNHNSAEGGAENQKEVTENMLFEKSKMKPEELATLEEFEKKYGIAGNEGTGAGAGGATADAVQTGAATGAAQAGAGANTAAGDVAKGAAATAGTQAAAGGTATAPGVSAAAQAGTAELHPEVRKALDDNRALAEQVLELTKSLEIKDLTASAAKYEIIGKKAEELAPKLYELKKAGGTAYADYVALLDEQLTLVEKGGLFAEVGKSRSGSALTGGELEAKAAEIRKSNSGLSFAEAFAKAYEENPELAAQYDAEYSGRRA
jgi:hypothetical protein